MMTSISLGSHSARRQKDRVFYNPTGSQMYEPSNTFYKKNMHSQMQNVIIRFQKQANIQKKHKQQQMFYVANNTFASNQ